LTSRIQHKRSSVAANVPGAGTLEIGELAINFVDRYIYTKNGASAVIRLTGAVPLVQPAANQVEGDSYIDIITGKMYVYFNLNGAGVAWNEIAPPENLAAYLPLVGGTMSGDRSRIRADPSTPSAGNNPLAGGFLKKHPADLAPCGCDARRRLLASSIRAWIFS